MVGSASCGEQAVYLRPDLMLHHRSPSRHCGSWAVWASALALAFGVSCRSTGEDEQQHLVIASSGSFEHAMRGVATVSLHPRGRIVRPRPGASAAELEQVTDRAIIDTLRERGFTVARPGQGQRLIAYGIGIEGRLADQEMLELFGISPGVDDPDEELRGGIVLAVVDTATGNVLWRGSASGPGDPPEHDTTGMGEPIYRAVQAIFAGPRTRLGAKPARR